MKIYLALFVFIFFAACAYASQGTLSEALIASPFGIAALCVFVVGYTIVILEDRLEIRKSKPVLVAAGFIWLFVGFAFLLDGRTHEIDELFKHNLLEYGEIMLFLFSAMTFINTLEERQFFSWIEYKISSCGLSLRTTFWIMGILAFCLSPVADNLTTALFMATIAMTVSANRKFVILSCINIVVAANAGGAFSPFGDITTLMVWQKGIVEFQEFFAIFIPSLVNWLIVAAMMTPFVPKRDAGVKVHEERLPVYIKKGGVVILFLLLVTIALAVFGKKIFNFPPVAGMMFGLGLLAAYGRYIKHFEKDNFQHVVFPDYVDGKTRQFIDLNFKPREKPFDAFVSVKRLEFDTLLFFYGVVMCVGGLSAFGYLAFLSEWSYGYLGSTTANVLVGILSAIVDNIPIMFAVLNMMPEMSHAQWLLVTLTAGVGGSMLSIGSAAGVALMGKARGVYTFMEHLKWTPVIALGYAASIYVHILINGY